MRKIIDISRIFVKSNMKKFIPAICTMCTFLLVLNILLGFIFSTTGIFSNSLTNNNTMHFMEVIFENESLNSIEEFETNVSSISEIENVIYDFSHPILVESEDGQVNEILNLIGLPQNSLKYFGIEYTGQEFFCLPKSKESSFGDRKKALFEEGEFYKDENNEVLSRIVKHNVDITLFYDDIEFDMLPPDLAIIDENRMLEITKKMSETGDYSIHRLFITVDDISKMKDVEEKLNFIYPDALVKYSLKYSNDLPSFSVVLIAASGVIIAILLGICIFNLRNSVNQIIDSRNRDIALLSLFGAGDKAILKMFVCEFIIYGLTTFVCATTVTFGLLAIFKFALGIDMLTDFYWIYLSFNLIISLIVFGIMSITQISNRLKKINNTKLFKEFLK